MRNRHYPLLAPIATLLGGVVLGLAITSNSPAPLIIIPLLGLCIGAVALRGVHFDIILWVVTAAAFLLPMNNVRLSANLTVGDGLMTIALLLIIVIRTGQHDLRLSGMDGLLLGLLMVIFGGLLGSFFADSIGASLAGLLRFGFATIALPVIFGLWRPSFGDLRVISWSIVLGSTLSAVVGIVAIRVVGRAQGFTTHPNHLALASLMAVGVALGLLLGTNGATPRLILLAAIALLTVSIVSSGSRSGLVAEVLVIAVVAVLTRRRQLIVACGTATAVVGLLLASGQLGKGQSSAFARLLGAGGASVSDQARAETLRAALHTVSLHPVTGQGFQLALATHDIVLEVAATAGLFGVVGFGIIFAVTIGPIWRRFHWGAAGPESPGDTLLIGMVAAVVGFFANGLFGNQLYDRYIWIVLTAVSALAYDLLAADERSSTPVPSGRH